MPHLLLALGELNEENILLSDTVARTAIGIPDRSVLFDASRKAVADQMPERSGQVRPEETVVENEPEIERVPTEPKTVGPEQETHDLPLTKQITSGGDDDELDQLIRSEVAKHTITIDLLQQKLDSFDPEESPVSEPKEVTSPAEPAEEEEPARMVPVNGRLSFTQWLDPDQGNDEIKQVLDEIIAEKKQRASEKVEFFSASKMAKRSLDDGDGLVTETLARIHAAQGNTEKAVETYKRLAAMHPEREAYFLSLAQELSK